MIRILLIIVVIGCLTHISWGQGDDIVNITPPSSLPAKSEVTHEDILNQAQRSLDRSMDLFNTVVTVMGVFGTLMTLILILCGAFGYIEISRLKELKQQAKESADGAKKDADEAKKAAEEARPIIDKLKKAEEEIDTFRESAKHFPSLSEPFSEDQEKTLDEYVWKSKLLELLGFPLMSEDYLNRGRAHYWRDEYKLALDAFDKAIELEQDYVSAWINRGFALGKLSRYDEALEALDKAIELKPGYAPAWNSRGFVLIKAGRYDEALEALDEAIKLKSDYASAWYNRACAYSRKEDKENARNHLSKAIELDAKYKEKAKSDEDFKNLWDDEDFKMIVS